MGTGKGLGVQITFQVMPSYYHRTIIADSFSSVLISPGIQ
jgi:hypothetical protein